MEKIFVCKRQSNETGKLYNVNVIEKVFDTFEKAEAWIDEKMSNVKQHTEQAFMSTDFGWLNPRLYVIVHESKESNLKDIIRFKYIDPETGKENITHYKVYEYEVE